MKKKTAIIFLLLNLFLLCRLFCGHLLGEGSKCWSWSIRSSGLSVCPSVTYPSRP